LIHFEAIFLSTCPSFDDLYIWPLKLSSPKYPNAQISKLTFPRVCQNHAGYFCLKAGAHLRILGRACELLRWKRGFRHKTGFAPPAHFFQEILGKRYIRMYLHTYVRENVFFVARLFLEPILRSRVTTPALKKFTT
jgi:hypothetical protein